MSPDDIKAMLGDRWLAVESYIKDSLDSDIGLLQSLNGKILSHGGKQLRPLLPMLSPWPVREERLPMTAAVMLLRPNCFTTPLSCMTMWQTAATSVAAILQYVL